MEDDDDEQLLRRTGEDPEAFGRFYARHERSVLTYFIRRVGDPETAADLCAETFAAALFSRRRFRSARGTPTAWLFGIARHQLQEWGRRRVVEDRARRRLGLLNVRATERQLGAIAELEGDITAEAFLDELPLDQAAAVRERVLGDESYEAIATRAGVSESTIRKRVSRGLAALRPHSKEF